MGGDGAVGKDILKCQTLGWLTLCYNDKREESGGQLELVWELDKRQKV